MRSISSHSSEQKNQITKKTFTNNNSKENFVIDMHTEIKEEKIINDKKRE